MPRQSSYLTLHEEWTRNWTGKNVTEHVLGPTVTLFLSGSTSEHLNMPHTFSRHIELTPEYVKEHSYASDKDVMVCADDWPLVDERRGASRTTYPSKRLGVVRVLPTTHPGYLMVEVDADGYWSRYSKLEDGHRYLDGDGFLEDAVSKLKCIQVTREGPALAIDDGFHKISDLVISFPVPVWPQEAEDFARRRRQNRWPDAALISRIVDSGCHVVRMGHHQSARQRLEFRWSFSAAETALVRTLGQQHRRPYLFLKMLHNRWLKQPKVLATYHLKTTLFWTVERADPSLWQPGRAAHALLALLDALIGYLGHYCVPNFFVPANNMISHVRRSDVDAVAATLRDLRRDPIGRVLQFLDENRFVVPSDTYVIVPPQEELRVWRQMPYRRRRTDCGDLPTVAVNFHRCGLHLALSWLVEITADCRAQNKRRLEGIPRQIYGCVLEAMRVGYEHREMTKVSAQNVDEFARFVRTDMAELVRQFSGSQVPTTSGQVNLPDVFRHVVEYANRRGYL